MATKQPPSNGLRPEPKNNLSFTIGAGTESMKKMQEITPEEEHTYVVPHLVEPTSLPWIAHAYFIVVIVLLAAILIIAGIILGKMD